MTTSYNGFPASPDPKTLGVTRLVVNGVEFVGGVKSGDVLTVLGHVAHEYDARVERLVKGQCFGFAYRKNRNANNISCHGSATAIDCNSAKHPNGVEASRTLSKAQIAMVHKILAEIPELAEVVHWGGDWHSPLTPDPMHFEIHDHDLAKLARVAKRIKEATVPAAKTDPTLSILADLTALTVKHGVSLVFLARVALFGAKSSGTRAVAVRGARALLKPFK